MPIVGALFILAAAAGLYAYSVSGRPSPDVPAAPSAPLPQFAPTTDDALVGQALIGIGSGVAVGGGGGAALAGLDIGAALGAGGGAASEAALLGGLTGALIAGGPLGAIVGGGLAIYSQQEALMAGVKAFRDVQYRMTTAEDAKWRGMKAKATTWPTSADPWRHKSLRAYEDDMVEKYASVDGIDDFRARLAGWMLGVPGALSPKGVAWALDAGLSPAAAESPTEQQALDAARSAWQADRAIL